MRDEIFAIHSEIMVGSTGNSKNVPKKPACTKLSNFVPILDRSIVTTPIFIISEFIPY